MVYLKKRYVPVVGADKIYGYYHFVRGAQPANVASVSAYIVDVVRNAGLDPLPWVSTGGWQIASATFVAYNIISKLDIKVHVNFPGSTSAFAVDTSGNDVPLTDTLWHELLVSSVVRNMSSHGEYPLYPCLRVVSSPALGVDSLFYEAASASCARWALSGHDASERPAPSPARSAIATAIRDHFLHSALYETAIHFFSNPKLHATDPDLEVYAAAAARMKGDLDAADQVIHRIIATNQQSPLAWMEKAHILRAKGDLQKALDAAKTASQVDDSQLEVCIQLADLFVDAKKYTNAFESLNGADVPTPPLDPFLRHLIPNRRNLTKPNDGSLRGTDVVRVLADRIREEKQLSNEKTDESLYELPAKLMTSTEKRCYSVLVKILNDLSWDQMLAVRGECFVMERDLEDGNGKLSISDVDDESDKSSIPEEGNGNHPSDTADAAEQLAQGVTSISLKDDDVHEDGHHDENGDAESLEARRKSLEKTGKKVCKPWLDYLVTNMYHDLKAMALWNAEEQQHSTESYFPTSSSSAEANGDAAASRDVEAQESEHTFQRTADEIVRDTKRPHVDWMRRGELALRLGKPEEAKVAFWACLKLAEKEKTVCATSLCRLLEMASDEGDVKTTIRCVDMLWSYLDSRISHKHSSEPSPAVPILQKSVFKLIAKRGLRVVRDVASSNMDINRKRLEGLLLDSVALRVDGFLR